MSSTQWLKMLRESSWSSSPEVELLWFLSSSTVSVTWKQTYFILWSWNSYGFWFHGNIFSIFCSWSEEDQAFHEAKWAYISTICNWALVMILLFAYIYMGFWSNAHSTVNLEFPMTLWILLAWISLWLLFLTYSFLYTSTQSIHLNFFFWISSVFLSL